MKLQRLSQSLRLLRKLNMARARWRLIRGKDMREGYKDCLRKLEVALEQNDHDGRVKVDARQLGLFSPAEAREGA